MAMNRRQWRWSSRDNYHGGKIAEVQSAFWGGRHLRRQHLHFPDQSREDVVWSLDSNQFNHAFRDNRAGGGFVFRF